jgi:hypothetical protein
MEPESELDRTVHGVTELRVHGVSGTPPEEMLNHPQQLVRRVSGDSRAGFWRRWYPGGFTHDAPEDYHLEAYSWGGLTSGPASRALWLVLLPFTLVNLAHWMLPPYTGRRAWAGRVAVALLRVIGLSYTLTLILAVTLVTADLGAWQCGAMPECAPRLGPLSFVNSWDTGPRLALGAALPALLIIVLWWLGRAELRPTGGTHPPQPTVRADQIPLAEPSFWAGDRSTVRLRAVHVTAACGTLGILSLGAAVRYGTTGFGHTLAVVLLVVDAVLLGLSVLMTLSNAATGRGGFGADRLTTPLVWLRWFALAVLAASLLAVAYVPASYPLPPSHLPVLREGLLVGFVVQLVLLLLLAVSVAVLTPWRSGSGPHPVGYAVAARGMATPLVTLLGWLIGGAFAAGLGLWVANYLGVPVTSTATAEGDLKMLNDTVASVTTPLPARIEALNADRPLIVPPAYFWAGTAALVTLALALVLLLVVVLRVRAVGRQLATVVATEHPGENAKARAAAVRRMRALTRLTDHAGLIVGGLVGIATVVVVAGMATYIWGGYAVVERAGWALLTNLGTATIAAAAAALISLAFLAFRDRHVRRLVGILWDVATFWPRANHPLTPPCYGERAVPELAERVAALTTRPDDRVVLSGHSQGSVLVVATVLQLDPAQADRTDLLTYGCPVRRLYARFFPAYVGETAITAADDAAGDRWLNLWVPSDLIGAWVLRGTGAPGVVDGLDEQLADPVSLLPDADGVLPPMCGHSGFLGRQEYENALNRLLTGGTGTAGG